MISPDSFNDQMQDVVVAAITSQLTDEQHAVIIEQGDCVDGMSPKVSVVKLTKVFTIHSTLIIKKLCALRDEKLAAILGQLRQFFS